MKQRLATRSTRGGPLIGAVLLMVAACSFPLVGGSGTAAVDAPASGEVGEVSFSDQPIRALPVDEVITIRRFVGRLFDECMAERGFPQYLEFTVPEEAVTSLDDNGLSVYMFGPSTREEALQYGYSPLLVWPRIPSFPKVIANDEAFEVAATECRSSSWGSLGESAEGTVRALDRLGETLHNASMEALLANEEFRRLHQARVACLAEAGFSVKRGPDVWLRPSGEHFGIRFGEVEEVFDEPVSGPAPGEVKVIYPPERSYTPGEQEVKLALADVACREKLGFHEKVLALAIEIQAELMEEIEPNLQELKIALDDILDTMRQIEGGG